MFGLVMMSKEHDLFVTISFCSRVLVFGIPNLIFTIVPRIGRSFPASDGVERCLRVEDGADHFLVTV